MPKRLEQKLRRQAVAEGFTGERADRYVYGTMRKTGWTPSREKGGKMERKHQLNALKVKIKRAK